MSRFLELTLLLSALALLFFAIPDSQPLGLVDLVAATLILALIFKPEQLWGS